MESKPILTTIDQGVLPDQASLLQKPGVVYVRNGRPESGVNGSYLWSNEPANELAFLLPAGYQLIGELQLTELDQTLLILSDGIHQQFGTVAHQLQPEPYTNAGLLEDCDVYSEPLPSIITPVGVYTPLLTTTTLSWTTQSTLVVNYQFLGQDLYVYLVDSIYPDRIIHWTVIDKGLLTLHIDSQHISGYDDCQAPIYDGTLDGDRCRLEPLADALTITTVATTTGGSWEASSVQFFAAYSTPTGERLTEFIAHTGIISLWDSALQTRSGQPTTKSIELIISSQSTHYTHVIIGVIQTIGSQQQAFILPTQAISAKTITLLGNEVRIPATIGDILESRTHYTNSTGLAVIEYRLLRWGLKEKPIVNLQPYLLNIPVSWQTIELPEGAYKEGVIAEKYRSYARDEVIALGIVFTYKDGDETGVYHLPGRIGTALDYGYIVDADSESYISLTPLRNPETEPIQHWEIRNSSVITGGSKQVYQSGKPIDNYQRGSMGYWQSTLTYPNRPDVWGGLCGQPIRHHKLPDSRITHIHDQFTKLEKVNTLVHSQSKIYPLGLSVDATSIQQAISQAEADGVVPADIITGWRIVRADRRGQASVQARGLLYNMPSYTHEGKQVYFPNYPFNDLRPDPFLTDDKTTYANFTQSPSKLVYIPVDNYTFHSPDTHFSIPGVADYITFDTLEFGRCEGQFNLINQEARQQITNTSFSNSLYRLTNIDQAISGSSGILSVLLPLSPAWWIGKLLFSSSNNVGLSSVLDKLQSAIGIKNTLLSDTPYINYALQYSGVGWYNQYSIRPIDGFRLRTLQHQAMLESSIQRVGEELINNRFRESSLFLKLDSTFSTAIPSPSVIDQSKYLVSETGLLDTDQTKPISSYYGTLRKYQPQQYGALTSINYLETGMATQSRNTTGLVDFFGGDVFINRFSFKRKHSFFTQTRFKQADGVDVNYSELANAAYPTYFYNTDNTILIDSYTSTLPSTIGIDLKTALTLVQTALGAKNNRLDNFTDKDFLSRGYIYQYSFGIPYFFAESSINLDLRQADNLKESGFYPLVDPQQWTQPETVSPELDNVYTYDRAYSHPMRENKLLAFPDSQLYNQWADQHHPNRVVYSEPRNYRYFKALNSYDFDRKNGDLTGLDGLPGDRLLTRFENSVELFNTYTQLQTSTELAQIGSGQLFATRPQVFTQSDGGLMGNQHIPLLNTPYGCVWVDQKRGGIYLFATFAFMTMPKGIHEGAFKFWFEQHLPAHLAKVPGTTPSQYPIRMVYDPTTHRVIITKKDYYVRKSNITYDNQQHVFLYNNTVISLQDPVYFGNASWTMAYHILSEQWAVLDFAPDWYLSWPLGFMSVINSPLTQYQSSGWIHRNSQLQYQRFFGQQVPFILKVWLGYSEAKTSLQSIQYSHQIRRYHQRDEYVAIPNVTYSKLAVSSEDQSTKWIDLKPADINNTSTLIENSSYLVQQPAGNWSINQLVNQVDKKNTLPIWISDATHTRWYLNEKAFTSINNPNQYSGLTGHGYWVWLVANSQHYYQYIHQWVKPVLTP